MIHSGSRGLGYQVCDDALAAFRNCPAKYGIELPDRQLACAPADSPEGRKYIEAMRAAANYGFMQPPTAHAAGPRSVRRRVRAAVGGPRHGAALRRGPQHREARRTHRRREEEEGVGPPQGRDAGVPGGSPGGAGGVPRRRPAGDHPRRHGAARRWVLVGVPGEHGEDVRHHLPRGRAGDEPHRGAKLDGVGRKIDKELEPAGRDRDGDQPPRVGGGAAEGVQERGRRGRGRSTKRTCRARSPGCGRSG